MPARGSQTQSKRTPFKNNNITIDNFHYHEVSDNWCAINNEGIKILEPSIRCNDMFSIDYDTTTNVSTLLLEKTGEKFSEYSLIAYDDMTYSAHVCQQIEDTTIRDG